MQEGRVPWTAYAIVTFLASCMAFPELLQADNYLSVVSPFHWITSATRPSTVTARDSWTILRCVGDDACSLRTAHVLLEAGEPVRDSYRAISSLN